MAEVDAYSFFVPREWSRTPEDQLIDVMILLQSEREWDDYTKEIKKTPIGDIVRFTYE